MRVDAGLEARYTFWVPGVTDITVFSLLPAARSTILAAKFKQYHNGESWEGGGRECQWEIVR